VLDPLRGSDQRAAKPYIDAQASATPGAFRWWRWEEFGRL